MVTSEITASGNKRQESQLVLGQWLRTSRYKYRFTVEVQSQEAIFHGASRGLGKNIICENVICSRAINYTQSAPELKLVFIISRNQIPSNPPNRTLSGHGKKKKGQERVFVANLICTN